jgi:hypothetical protein
MADCERRRYRAEGLFGQIARSRKNRVIGTSGDRDIGKADPLPLIDTLIRKNLTAEGGRPPQHAKTTRQPNRRKTRQLGTPGRHTSMGHANVLIPQPGESGQSKVVLWE